MLQGSFFAAFAQISTSFSTRCQVSTSPLQVRAEGLTERVGDIQLQCSGSAPGSVFNGNFTVFLPVNVTNRVDSNNFTRDAVLSVDLGSGPVPTGIAGQVQVSGNAISFNGVSYTTPASGKVNLRISNIRAAMNQLGYTSTNPAAVTGYLSSTLAVDQSQITLAYSQAGMLSNMTDSAISCYGSPMPDTMDLAGFFAAGTAFSSTRVTEGFAASFQARGEGADTGTRFLLKFSGFPAATRLFVPDAVAGSNAAQPTSGGDLNLPQAVGKYVPGSGTLVLVRVSGADATGAGGLAVSAPQGSGAVTLGSVSEIALSNGTGYAVYEVADSNLSAQESAQFPVFVALPRFTAPAIAQETVALAPLSVVTTASASAPIPRFAAVAMLSDCALLPGCAVPVVRVPRLELEAAPIRISAVAGGTTGTAGGAIKIHNSGGGSMDWSTSIIYQNGAAWLTLDKTSGNNEGSVQVTATATTLSAGTYQATVIVDGGAAGRQSVPVTLGVTAPPPPPPATPTVVVSRIVNAATLEASPLVAGSLATLMGSHLTGAKVDVTFDGAAASVLYSGETQINLQVPASLGGKTTASVVVTVDGVSSAPQMAPLAPAWPAVFPHGVLNQDSRENSGAAAAKAGDILQIFATGIPKLATVSGQIGDTKDLVPVYAGEAPTVPGVQQVNVAVPGNVKGAVSLKVCATVGAQQYCSPGYSITVQ